MKNVFWYLIVASLGLGLTPLPSEPADSDNAQIMPGQFDVEGDLGDALERIARLTAQPIGLVTRTDGQVLGLITLDLKRTALREILNRVASSSGAFCWRVA